MDFKRVLKVREAPISSLNLCLTLQCNAKSFLYGNKVFQILQLQLTDVRRVSIKIKKAAHHTVVKGVLGNPNCFCQVTERKVRSGGRSDERNEKR